VEQAFLGRFWSWDEREVFSLILWLLYAGLLQARLVVGWRGRRAATVTIIGFAVVLVSFVFGHVLFPAASMVGASTEMERALVIVGVNHRTAPVALASGWGSRKRIFSPRSRAWSASGGERGRDRLDVQPGRARRSIDRTAADVETALAEFLGLEHAVAAAEYALICTC